MPRFFTQLWTGEEYECQRREAGNLHHAVSNQFSKRGIKPGDFLYVWSFIKGRLYLLGRMQVRHLCSTVEARKLLKVKPGLYLKKGDHIIADPESVRPVQFYLDVKPDLMRRLRFAGNKPPKYKPFPHQSEPEPQTFRGVRELTPESARELDRLLGIQ